jgi:hypothetical protein
VVAAHKGSRTPAPDVARGLASSMARPSERRGALMQDRTTVPLDAVL